MGCLANTVWVNKEHNVEQENDFFDKVDETASALTGILQIVKKQEQRVCDEFLNKTIKSCVENKRIEIRNSIRNNFEVT